MTLVVMASGPVDNKTWRTFDFADVKKFAWDACREVAVNETYSVPWTFQDFLTASKRKAYKSDDRTTVDSFFNNNNIYISFIEEIIKEVVFWGQHYGDYYAHAPIMSVNYIIIVFSFHLVAPVAKTHLLENIL